MSGNFPARKNLPARPSQENLRKQAKRRAKAASVPLAKAQHLLAAEYGCRNWGELMRLVEAVNRSGSAATLPSEEAPSQPLQAGDPELAAKFLRAATPEPDSNHKSGNLIRAREILAANPALPSENFYVACAVGDPSMVEMHLQRNPALAAKPGGPRDWLPLLYLAFSRFNRFKDEREIRFVQCGEILLKSGAEANSYWTPPGNPNEKETALYGAAGIANSAPLTQLLLAAGADPNDHESLYHAAEFEDNAALKVLLPTISKPDWVSYCMCHKMDMEDPAGLQLFLDHKADPNFLIGHGQRKGDRPLHFALIRHRSPKIIRTLLENGADPDLPDSAGITPHQVALRLGNLEAAKLLLEHGAKDDATPKLRLLAALSAGNSDAAHRLLSEHPGVLAELTDGDHALLIDAAESGNEKAVALMLGPPFDFPIDIRKAAHSAWDATALHHAAWHGHPEIVAVLLRRGADPHLTHSYGGNALTTTMHAAIHDDPAELPAHLQTLTHLAGYFAKEDWEKALGNARAEGNAALEGHLRSILEGR